MKRFYLRHLCAHEQHLFRILLIQVWRSTKKRVMIHIQSPGLGVLMSHVDFKKCQCRTSLLLRHTPVPYQI